MKEVGVKIKKLRKKMGGKQREVAATLGISIAAYSKIEAGITDINASRIFQLASYFRVKPSVFFEDSDDVEKLENERKEWETQVRKMETLIQELQSKLIFCLQENKELQQNLISS